MISYDRKTPTVRVGYNFTSVGFFTKKMLNPSVFIVVSKTWTEFFFLYLLNASIVLYVLFTSRILPDGMRSYIADPGLSWNYFSSTLSVNSLVVLFWGETTCMNGLINVCCYLPQTKILNTSTINKYPGVRPLGRTGTNVGLLHRLLLLVKICISNSMKMIIQLWICSCCETVLFCVWHLSLYPTLLYLISI